MFTIHSTICTYTHDNISYPPCSLCAHIDDVLKKKLKMIQKAQEFSCALALPRVRITNAAALINPSTYTERAACYEYAGGTEYAPEIHHATFLGWSRQGQIYS